MSTFAVHIEVRLREGISDPEGATIERALPALGFAGVSQVRAGKSFRLAIDADSAAAAEATARSLCERLLANPVMEDVVISVE